jgi:endonuclease/exonuclease/phosphatase family metal-dependent hydrolase
VTRIRVATYNIYMGARRGSAVDGVVRGIAPDVLLVNECPKQPLLWRRACRRLAERWGLSLVSGGRPAGSNLVLAGPGVSVKSAGAERLRQPLFQPRRGIAWAQLRVHGQLLGVVSCHLSLDRDRRLREVERILEVAARLRGPVVLGGDLNERPGGPVWRRLSRAGFVDGNARSGDPWLTFPSEDPQTRIDALLLRSTTAHFLSHGGPDGVPDASLTAASDHRPVVADIRLV